eukprot:3529486-Pleurochrysis_carterae.AAC.1
MAPVDVLGPLVMFRVVREVNRGLVVHGQRSRRGAGESQISEEGSEVHRLLGGLAGSHDFGLAGREGDTGGRVAGRPIGVRITDEVVGGRVLIAEAHRLMMVK